MRKVFDLKDKESHGTVTIRLIPTDTNLNLLLILIGYISSDNYIDIIQTLILSGQLKRSTDTKAHNDHDLLEQVLTIMCVFVLMIYNNTNRNATTSMLLCKVLTHY